MNLRDLKYFVAVAEHKHFGKAAAACFVSQPTLSAQLKKLEDSLGVILFERDNKHVMLTSIGEECLATAKRVLAEVEELCTQAKQSQDPFSGQLRLGVIPTIAPYLLPKFIPFLSAAFPKLTLLLEEIQTEPMLKALAEGNLDAGILALPIPAHGMEVYSLFEEPFVMAIPDGHPLAKLKQIPIKTLSEHLVLLLEEGHCLRDQTLAFCHHLKLREKQDFRATSLETLRQMVVAKVGVSVMPKMATQANPGITYRPFSGPAPKREIVLMTRPTSSRKVLMQEISNIIRNAAS